MAYLGSTPTTQSFIAGTDTFSGTGAQTVYTLSRSVNSVNDILVVVNNVDQQPSNYTVSGTTLTFSPAPSSGTNNIYVRYLSTTLQSITVPGGTTVSGSFGLTGNLQLAGTGQRITGDFTGAAVNRVAFQTSTANSNTGVSILPSGSATTANLRAFNNSQPTNSAYMAVVSTAGDARVESGILGTGTYLPMTFFTGGSERMRIDSAGNLLFNSGYGSVATAYGCRAWVNFNGTGTVAIRGSGNVSSITDNGVGDYTVNFTNAMPDINYEFNVSTSSAFGVASCGAVQINTNGAGSEIAQTTAAFRFTCVNSAVTANIDPKYVNTSVFR